MQAFSSTAVPMSQPQIRSALTCYIGWRGQVNSTSSEFASCGLKTFEPEATEVRRTALLGTQPFAQRRLSDLIPAGLDDLAPPSSGFAGFMETTAVDSLDVMNFSTVARFCLKSGVRAIRASRFDFHTASRVISWVIPFRLPEQKGRASGHWQRI
jgi:hypothetical protein